MATNALLERNGAPTALVITAGFRDLLFIGNQSRPNIFDLEIATHEVLYESVVEVEERVVLERDGCYIDDTCPRVKGLTDDYLRIEKGVDVKKVEQDLMKVYEKGIRSLAVVFTHAYTFHNHEVIVGDIAKKIGFTQVSLSHKVMPMVKMVPRGYTACADAYLTPVILTYLQGFREGFDDGFNNIKVSFMQSNVTYI